MQFPELPEIQQPDEAVTYHFEDVQFDLPSDTDKISAWLMHVADMEQRPFHEVNYIFCSDEYLLNINKEYLQHDFYTDVITFPYAEDGIFGDVFISSERVADNARMIGVSFEDELLRVMLHGVLHLAGYRDETDEEEALMREKENTYLEKVTMRG